jgi:hypothetical protein
LSAIICSEVKLVDSAKEFLLKQNVETFSPHCRSYEQTSLWPLLEAPPEGLHLDFVKAEGSVFRYFRGRVLNK